MTGALLTLPGYTPASFAATPDLVAVIGLGLLGQLTVQLLKAAGCRVLGLDINPARAELARHLGADAVAVSAADFRDLCLERSQGVGVDSVLIAAETPSSDPVNLAGAIAREGALKLKESSYLHAEGYPAGELKHGPNALVSDSVPLVVLATVDHGDPESVLRYGKTTHLLRDLKAQGANVFAVVNSGDDEVKQLVSASIEILPASCPI